MYQNPWYNHEILRDNFRFSVISFLIIFFLTGISNQAQAQYKRNKSSITGSKFRGNKNCKRRLPKNYLNSVKGLAGLSANTYFGDLCDGKDCQKFKPGLTLGAQYRYNEHFTFRSTLSWRRLGASDENGNNASRNLHFRSDNFELALTATYDPFAYNKMFMRRHVFSPYGFLGIGILQFNPTAKYDGKWHSLRPIQTEGVRYGAVTMVIPYGFGARIKVNPKLDLSFELGYRWTFTYYLDDVSDKYDSDKYKLPADDPERILTDRRKEYDNAFNTQGGKRGDSSANDGYIVYGFQLEYTLKVTQQHNSLNSRSSKMRVIKSVKKRR